MRCATIMLEVIFTDLVHRKTPMALHEWRFIELNRLQFGDKVLCVLKIA